MLLPDDLSGEQQKALDLFRQIVALDPSFTEAQIKLANLLLQIGPDSTRRWINSRPPPRPIPIPSPSRRPRLHERLRGQNDDARAHLHPAP